MLRLPDIRDRLGESGVELELVNVTRDESHPVVASLSSRQVDMIRAGSALNLYRERMNP